MCCVVFVSPSIMVGLDVFFFNSQVMDMECEGKDGVGLDELRWIHRHKTAALLKVRHGVACHVAYSTEQIGK